MYGRDTINFLIMKNYIKKKPCHIKGDRAFKALIIRRYIFLLGPAVGVNVIVMLIYKF